MCIHRPQKAHEKTQKDPKCNELYCMNSKLLLNFIILAFMCSSNNDITTTTATTRMSIERERKKIKNF